MKVSMRTALRLFPALVIAVASIISLSTASAATLVTIYDFMGTPTDGYQAIGGLIRDSKSGLYYGVTSSGGTQGAGTVFQLTPPVNLISGWTEKVIYNFSKSFGDFPYAELIVDQAGALYGTTGFDGPMGEGTVYKLTPPATAGGKWTGRTLYAFKSDNSGFEPYGRLLLDASGALYGTTYKGGTGNPFGGGSPCPFGCGVVFKLTPDKSGGTYAYTILHKFQQGSDGSHPVRGVVMDKAGALYGTTLNGGSNQCFNGGDYGCGLVFKLKPPVAPKTEWTEQILYRFADNSNGGSNPSELTLDASGHLFGAAPTGGAGKAGLIYELSPVTGSVNYKLTGVHLFKVGTEISSLTANAKGVFFGTTRNDGATNNGTAFRLAAPTVAGGARAYSILHSFTVDDKHPLSNLALEPSGNLLGYTQSGGPSNTSTIYELRP